MPLVVSTPLLFLEITEEERKGVEIRWGTVNSWFIPVRLGFSKTQNHSTGRSVLRELPNTKIDVLKRKGSESDSDIRTYLRTRDLKFQRADCSYPWVMRATALNQLLILKKYVYLRLMMFEKRLVRNIFGPERGRSTMEKVALLEASYSAPYTIYY